MLPRWQGRLATRFSLPEGRQAAFMLCALGAALVPGFRPARRRAWQRACYANQKTIAGAIEMYEQDHGKSLTALTPAVMEKVLQPEGYLWAMPKDPGFDRGSAGHYRRVGEDVYCLCHGAIQGKAPGPCRVAPPWTCDLTVADGAFLLSAVLWLAGILWAADGYAVARRGRRLLSLRSRGRCPVCGDPVWRDVEAAACGSCGAAYHGSCFALHGACVGAGCQGSKALRLLKRA